MSSEHYQQPNNPEAGEQDHIRLKEVNVEIEIITARYRTLLSEKGILEKKLGINQKVRAYPVLGESNLMTEHKIYCDYDELSKYENQAKRNHSQSLSELARRGGLSINEIYSLVTGISFHEARRLNTPKMMIEELIKLNIFKKVVAGTK